MHFRTEEIADRVRAATTAERRAVRDAIGSLARPRLSGSPGAARVARDLRARLEALDYTVRELPFRFSVWPGRWGVPLGAALFGLGIATMARLVYLGAGGAALVAAVATVVVIGALGLFYGRAIDALPWGRIESANWLAHRPGARPRFLVVAHRDSKSQPVSTLVRTAAVVAAAASWALLTTLALAAAVDPNWTWTPLTVVSGGLGLAAAATLLFARAGNDSAGALDNASGLAALLAVAARERDHDDVAFLITDGEELGLAGARAVRDRLPAMEGAINLDGLDDGGELRVIERHGWPRRGAVPHLTSALLATAAALDVPARRQDLPIGIMVDQIALAEAGLPCVTLMRGTFASLRRVHRPSDSPERLDGSGAAEAAAVVSGALRLLRDAGPAGG
ncbi:MAG: M28 family peptidase [Gemmatimonadota bacterium]